jgi:hypothetical protein
MTFLRIVADKQSLGLGAVLSKPTSVQLPEAPDRSQPGFYAKTMFQGMEFFDTSSTGTADQLASTWTYYQRSGGAST